MQALSGDGRGGDKKEASGKGYCMITDIYIRVNSINAEPSPTASSKTHPDTGWPSSYGNSQREQSSSLLLWASAKC